MNKRKWLRGGAPKMSFRTLYMEGEFPAFFGWVGADKKIAGSGEVAFEADLRKTQLDNLWEAGVRGIVTLTEGTVGGGPAGEEDVRAHGFAYLHLPTEDLTAPSLRSLLEGCAFIDAVAGGVLVHCREGVGRTGTMLAAYLMHSVGLGPSEACDRVRSARSGSIHKKCQEEMLHRFGQLLRSDDLRRRISDDALEVDALELEVGTPVDVRSPVDPFGDITLVASDVTSPFEVLSPPLVQHHVSVFELASPATPSSTPCVRTP